MSAIMWSLIHADNNWLHFRWFGHCGVFSLGSGVVNKFQQEITELDLRMPQFRDAKLDDLEFDSTGEVVRKDRFETSMRKISGMLHGVNGLSARSGWTCEQVVEAHKH